MRRVLVVGDCHCPGMHPQYPPFLQRMEQAWNTDTVVFIGDVTDWGAISYHEKDPYMPSPADEFEKAYKQVQRLYKAFPSAHVILGNHDALPTRKGITAGLPVDVLFRPFNEVWDTPGWTIHPRYSRLEIDGVIYAHGDAGKAGMYAGVKNSRDNFSSWVQGHCHTEFGVWYTANESKTVFGMNVGWGGDFDQMCFNYGRKYNRRPVGGCGIVLGPEEAYPERFVPEGKS